MNTERSQVGWGFWLWWVLASLVGFAVGFWLQWVLDSIVGDAVRGAVVGASVRIAQWLVLRRQISGPGWWVLANIVGFAVVGAGREAEGFTVAFVVGGALYGAFTGAALVWLLRQPITQEPIP